MTKISVIYPTFNERESAENNLRDIFVNFEKIKLEPEIVIVDDSKDGSEEVFERIIKNYKNIKFIHRINEKGVGSAIKKGISEATGKYVIVSMFDSPREILYFSDLIKKLDEGYDLVHTSRFIGGAKMIGYPFKKLIANRVCNNLISLLFWRFDLKDFTSLFKAFKRDKILELNLEAVNFDLGLEIATKSIRKGYKIIEIPVDWIERDVGESKLILRKQVPNYFKRLIKIWWSYR